MHEVGVHVTNGADGTWRPAPHDHGKCFTDVAPVLTEKTGVAVDVEHTVETGKKMRNLALERELLDLKAICTNQVFSAG